jgi:hypothetical protein
MVRFGWRVRQVETRMGTTRASKGSYVVHVARGNAGNVRTMESHSQMNVLLSEGESCIVSDSVKHR